MAFRLQILQIAGWAYLNTGARLSPMYLARDTLLDALWSETQYLDTMIYLGNVISWRSIKG